MLLTYEKKGEEVVVEWKNSTHVPPHLHEAIEMIYVTDGTLELGVERELYHMNEGDFAIVFPNVIHHYQVFGMEMNKAIYLCAESTMFPTYLSDLQKYTPQYPVIESSLLHPDVVNAMKVLANMEKNNPILVRAYVQVIMAHVFSKMQMVPRESIGRNDMIYEVVEYVAKNFREDISLDKMAYDLGVNKYVLSRMFAKTFHCNFNKYVNGVRLAHASALLESTQEAITNICLECGFESQRTFNRVFKEQYKLTPREYRNKVHMT